MSPGFPRIRKRLGAMGIELFQWTPRVNTQKDWDRCVVIIDRLVADHQVEVLRAIMDGEVATGELLDADRRQELTGSKIMARVKLGRLLWPGTEKGKPVKGAIAETLPFMAPTDGTRNLYRMMLESLRKQAVVPWPKSPMRVRDLLEVQWSAMAEGWPHSASDWNHVVRAVRAFLTKYLGSSRHEFREQFGKLVPLLPEDPRVPDITPELFRAILADLPTHAAAIAMGLLLTGFRRSEFFAADEDDLMSKTRQVRVPGNRTKTKKGRIVGIDEELWPWIVASIPAPIGPLQFIRYWRKACVKNGAGGYVPTGKKKVVRKKLEVGQNFVRKGHRAVGVTQHEAEMVEVPQLRYTGLRPHDLRHALGQWTTDEGRTLTQLKTVFGHANTKMAARYTESVDRGEVAASIGSIVKKRVLNQ